ncbi:hypothetical protein GVN16_08315 [Emticicia sp. CRIBPO]|uniref:leucine-rich repeat domain-containing protein n=1 Tax=Emticicia sp. CRIBPO TaxID=2683258 RepID=UPI001412BB02|nr:hypothetical protein [Emticicia sp. CRIBPO]NBA85759.1 hypothetical protein [Emticicia sp. CRIBPO]
MKHFTLILVSLLICFTAYSQQRIFHATEKDSLILSVSEEYRSPTLEDRSRLFGSGETMRVAEAREQYRLTRLFKLYAYEEQLDFGDMEQNCRLIITFLVGPEKKTDYCFFETNKMTFTGTTMVNEAVELTTEKEEKLMRVLGRMVRETTPSMEVDYAYQFDISLFPKGMFIRSTDKRIISTVEEAQRTTRPDTVIALNFSGLMLKEVPPVIFRFKNLKFLDLSKNYLSEFRAKPGKLRKLKGIDLSENDLVDVSVEFGKYRKMTMIKMMNNRLAKIPEGIKAGRRLEYAWFAHNPMVNFEKSNLRKIRRAKNINLYHCRIPGLPPSIGKLKWVETLDIYHNRLKFVPAEIGKLKRLNTLAISNNQLWKLPDEIGRLKNLKKLYAHHNKLDRLPELPSGLKLLDIGYNEFTDYPAGMGPLPELEEFDFSFNKMNEVPQGLLQLPKLKSVFMNANEFNGDKSKSVKLKELITELEKKSVAAKR